MHQDIVLNPGDSVSISVPASTPAETIADVKVENADGSSETFVPETPTA